MKRLAFVLFIFVAAACSAYAADEIRLLGVEDLEIATGGTGSAETSVSDGGVTSTKIDATHINLRASPGNSIETELGLKMIQSVYDTDTDNVVDTAASANAGDSATSFFSSGTIEHEYGGLEADVSAYDGLVKITGGATSSVTVTTAGEAILDDASALAQRTTLGVAIGSDVQAYDVDLETLSSPTAWRIFYSDGSSAITELAPGASGTYLKSNGSSAAPTFDTPTGTGDVVGPSSAIDNQIVLFDSTTGKLVKASDCTIDATGINCPGSATDSGEWRGYELTGNGTNYEGFKAPDAITGNVLWVLPDGDGSNGQVLKTNGSAVLSWADDSDTGGAPAFSAITGATNTTAAMVVGTGSSISASGSGAITATAAPWGGVTGTPTTISGYGITDAVTSVASGTSALGTGAIASATCATAVTTSATGTATTDVIDWGFNGDPTAVTGYVPLTTGMLTIIAYPTADNVNFKVCNNTSASITPGAITLNWKVTR